MQARLLNPRSAYDVKLLFDFLGDKRGDVNLDLDLIFMAETDGHIASLLVSRPMNYVHEFRVLPSSNALRAAESAINFATGFGAAVGSRVGRKEGSIFVIDPTNEPLKRILNERNAVLQEGGEFYTLELK